MNSRTVPWRSSMTSAIFPRTKDSNDSTSCGLRSAHVSSNPSMSQKRTLTVHFATPIVASMPLLNSRCTTHGGTYKDHERIVIRIDWSASWRSCSSKMLLLDSGKGLSNPSPFDVRISREDIATMSSATDRKGFTSMPVNFWILTFRTRTKMINKETTATIVSRAKRLSSRACAVRSKSTMPVLVERLQATELGVQACNTSDALKPMFTTSVSARAKGSSSAGGTPLGEQVPDSK
mmetsp:Transcript_54929/g.123977  ORF Transcript_54929/g.123977 Transcript_54929/m.123977 type:complete len:235 (-) Transcript_54929:793-1497(-)